MEFSTLLWMAGACLVAGAVTFALVGTVWSVAAVGGVMVAEGLFADLAEGRT